MTHAKRKSTKGPWVIDQGCVEGWAQISTISNVWGSLAQVAVEIDGKPNSEGEANALLIAQALRACIG